MSAAWPIITVATALLGMALAGPFLLRKAAPALVRFPHLASALIPAGALLWLAGLFSMGPLLAWLSQGPVVLPNDAAEICQRCIAAANPFGEAALTTMVPPILLFLIPASAALALTIGLIRQYRKRRAHMRQVARALVEGGTRTMIAGYRVTIIPREDIVASSLPASAGGIVLSRGALDVLSDTELLAVLAHEHAHVVGRHHFLKAVTDSLAALIGWVPLMGEIGRVLPGYLEIAADRRAQKATGTAAVVSALVTLGERQHDSAILLHMAGPERVRQLIAPVRGAAGALPAAAMGLHLLALAGFTALVLAPYGSALIAGCL